MINQVYIRGGNLRRVNIDKRVITFMFAENGFEPIQFDLDKLKDEDIKKYKMDDRLINEMRKLVTEKEMARDIKDDFQKAGWRLTRRGIS